MRERISESMSDYFVNVIELPELIKDYETIFQDELLAQRAYAVMLTKSGIIDAASGKKILEGLDYVRENLKKEDLNADYEDLYYNIEKCLVGRIGVETGGKLHTGRSRNDIGSTMNRMQVRKSLLAVMEALLALREILADKAQKEKDIIITGYTHTQPAQPTCMGHYYMAVFQALTRDFDRLKSAFQNTNHCPYGTAASQGATFPVDRDFLAKALGFDSVLENSLDCIASKDFLLEAEMAYVNMLITLSRFAQDLYVWSTYEFGLLEFGGQVAVCSSIMPQKKNAAGLEYVKSKVSHPIGTLNSTLATLKNIPFTNCIDIHEALWLYSEGVTETLKVLGMMKECLEYSHINEKRAYEAARKNFCTVTGLADHLVKTCDLSFEQAHYIVGTMIAAVIDSSVGVDGMTGALLAQVTAEYLGYELHLTDEEIVQVLDPRYNVQSKVSFGGPQKSSVEGMIAAAKVTIEEEESWLTAAQGNIQKGYDFLRAEEQMILG